MLVSYINQQRSSDGGFLNRGGQSDLYYTAFALDMYGKGIWTKDPREAKELAGHIRGKPILRQRARAGLEILKKDDRGDPDRIH